MKADTILNIPSFPFTLERLFTQINAYWGYILRDKNKNPDYNEFPDSTKEESIMSTVIFYEICGGVNEYYHCSIFTFWYLILAPKKLMKFT